MPAVHDGWMWDLTVPGNGDHDFYVAAGTATDILVHNINGPCEDSPGETPSFYRGARPGEEPTFVPRPNEYKVDPSTGAVRPTHGVSLFDNPASVSSKGFVPYEVDQSSLPGELRIIQRGADPSHYEIVPQQGTSLTPQQFTDLLCQISCRLGNLFMPIEERPVLILPEDFDDYAWEVESKGVFWDVRLRYGGREFPLTFYEPHRLTQDVADQLEDSSFFFEQNLVIVRKVTREAMELAAQELVRAQRIDGLRSI